MQVANRRSQAERREETRGQLLAAARKLFAEKGFADTSTPEIVAAAGVTRGALYHHFADKTALFAAVVEQEHQDRAAAIEAAGDTMPADPLAALLAGSDAFFAAMADPGRRRILLVDAPAVLGRDMLDDIDARTGLETLVCGLRDAMEAGFIRPLPVLPLAQLFGALYDRAALAPIEQQDDFRTAMAAMLEGLRA
ncbi:MAG: TetR/AcrR family transcriptional regulator [Devosia sp.]|uniref:TetR/AcrR family transcriptional regulator n=1 Tax=Devosia sp. TaxID=1871048 RepID=UPI0024CDA7DB|nr:helix-turn-helix domain-containing protein [Devosia sp.]UYN99231.1 MAG: TetR/AcrR family transcriptional regulator [Devosia sp.]